MKRGLRQICSLAICAFTVPAFAATDLVLWLQPPELTNGTVQIQLLGETDVPYVIETSSNSQNWSPVTTNTGTASTRWIALPASSGPAFYRAQRAFQPRFPAAIVARQDVALKGNYVRVDSYDSTDPAHDEPTSPDEIKAGGDIYCQGDVNAGNSVIHGKVKHGGSLFQGTNGIVGGLDWTNRGSIQPGWAHADYRFVMPEIMPPFSSWMTPTLTSSNTFYLTAGDYKYSGTLPFPGFGTLMVTGGEVRLWVTGGFKSSALWSVNILPGAMLKIYVGDEPSVSTNYVKAELFNVDTGDSTDAKTFQYYGFPNNLQIKWSGNDTYRGTIYAPQAEFTVGGGGSGSYNFMGACVVRSVEINGHFSFHFDENLRASGPQR